MNSEKVKEIKKALECCSKGKCENCLIGKKDIRKCIDILFKSTLTLINELENKIENGTLIELPCVVYNVKECRYQIISTKNGRVYASKFYRDRKEAEARLKELQEEE